MWTVWVFKMNYLLGEECLFCYISAEKLPTDITSTKREHLSLPYPSSEASTQPPGQSSLCPTALWGQQTLIPLISSSSLSFCKTKAVGAVHVQEFYCGHIKLPKREPFQTPTRYLTFLWDGSPGPCSSAVLCIVSPKKEIIVPAWCFFLGNPGKSSPELIWVVGRV